ncbi:MAG: hypothetical protein H0U49_10265 [Parachlamydiaceae bacterium]|nr:hypothetical protein [Parachlamydiaceae bacterium]
MQSRTINLWNVSEASIDDNTSKGYVEHPAKIVHSFPFTTALPIKPRAEIKVAQSIKDLLFQFRTETTYKAALDCLMKVQAHGWLRKFSERRDNLAITMKEVPHSERFIYPVLKASGALTEKIKNIFEQLTALLQKQEEKRLLPLYFAKMLDCLFFENGKRKGGVGQYSIVNMGAHFAAAEEQLSYQRELDHPANFINELLLGVETPIPKIFGEFRKFLLELEAIAEKNEDPQTITEFKKMLGTLKELGVMPWFMTFTFGESRYLPALDRVNYFLSLLPESEKPLVKELLEKKDALQVMHQQIDAFREPEKFKKAFENLKKEMEKFLPNEQEEICLQNILVAERWEKTSPLIRVVVIEIMNKLVELNDTAIKNMKSSLNFSDDKEKITLFKEMLLSYFSLLKSWSQKTLRPNVFPMIEPWTLEFYLGAISNRLEGMRVDDAYRNHLNPSRDFSVSAAMLGSSTAFERHYPETMEDVFTLIHQNLLATTAMFSNQLLSNESISKCELPLQLKTAILGVPSIEGNGVGVPQRIGVEIEENRIAFHYNVPLRNHSSRFTLCYTLEKESAVVTMKAQFLGQAIARWRQSGELADFYGDWLNLAHTPSKVTPSELVYSFKLENETAINHSLQLYKAISDYSLDENYDILRRQILSKFGDRNLKEKAIISLLKMEALPEFTRDITMTILEEIWEGGNELCKVKIPKCWQVVEMPKLLSKLFGDEIKLEEESSGEVFFSPSIKLVLELYKNIAESGKGL